MNKKMLRAEMILHDDTNATLANALGITPQSLSSKMNGTNGAEFTQGEIMCIISRYSLTNDAVREIFLPRKCLDKTLSNKTGWSDT